eukprot:scaffold4329_cov115-Cylindrotheca_fusiformis.AAC.11
MDDLPPLTRPGSLVPLKKNCWQGGQFLTCTVYVLGLSFQLTDSVATPQTGCGSASHYMYILISRVALASINS